MRPMDYGPELAFSWIYMFYAMPGYNTLYGTIYHTILSTGLVNLACQLSWLNRLADPACQPGMLNHLVNPAC
jgi:hypothetical protein